MSKVISFYQTHSKFIKSWFDMASDMNTLNWEIILMTTWLIIGKKKMGIRRSSLSWQCVCVCVWTSYHPSGNTVNYDTCSHWLAHLQDRITRRQNLRQRGQRKSSHSLRTFFPPPWFLTWHFEKNQIHSLFSLLFFFFNIIFSISKIHEDKTKHSDMYCFMHNNIASF